MKSFISRPYQITASFSRSHPIVPLSLTIVHLPLLTPNLTRTRTRTLTLHRVSLSHWNDDEIYGGGFGGAHAMVVGGYSRIMEGALYLPCYLSTLFLFIYTIPCYFYLTIYVWVVEKNAIVSFGRRRFDCCGSGSVHHCNGSTVNRPPFSGTYLLTLFEA